MLGPVSDILLGGMLAYGAAALAATGLLRARLIPQPSASVPAIDGLRGVLALAVLVHHFAIWQQVARSGVPWGPLPALILTNLGAGGVGLFFMVTGYVFYPRILQGLRALDLPGLYLTRLFRIYPALVVSVLLVVALIAARRGLAAAGSLGHEIDAVLTWLTCQGTPPLLGEAGAGQINAFVLWSLWYEGLFYLFVVPVCAAAMDAVRGRLPSWAVPAALLVGALLLRPLLKGALPLVTYLPLFAVGMLAHEVAQRERLAAHLRGRAAALAGLCAVTLALATQAVPGKPAALILYGAFFLCAACGNGFGILRSGAAQALGACSYGIYLLHGLVLSLLFVDLAAVTGRIGTAWLPLLIPAAAVATTLLAALVHRQVELPGIRAGRALSRLRIPRLVRLPARAA
ncbi:acyltransferase family protein [Methylobacterium symbioticum]|uniref:Acyltransferase 3 domain-containing protein n=1 Tax=Methylobacterium symbioticum TaxID=2584084 RepID=A0A509EEB7_9HYPH|nr:acyltransferase family protein [Methylobacterium symbioticum]VUD72458.1 hypothetical protein MET9862_03057 [Methylobacterium symbioticum]